MQRFAVNPRAFIIQGLASVELVLRSLFNAFQYATQLTDGDSNNDVEAITAFTQGNERLFFCCWAACACTEAAFLFCLYIFSWALFVWIPAHASTCLPQPDNPILPCDISRVYVCVSSPSPLRFCLHLDSFPQPCWMPTGRPLTS